MNEPKQPSAVSPSPDRPEWDRYSGVLRIFVMCNALLAFALELAMLVFVAWWALELDLEGWWARLLIALVAVGALVVLWGAFASPKARLPLPVWGTLAVKAVAFGAGTLALWGLGLPAAAIAFAVVAIANTAVATYVRRPR
ncbi:YrdB family protein [Glycomyces harbinensis]|uniref:YrdB family protein n=1 Tax=Glycomyces harbinensis TaxID=58114 RepID=UPI0015A596B7|nr:YrdB family protein [Glycomyces harbinensis]